MIFLYNEHGKRGAETFREIHNYLIDQGATLEEDGYASEYSLEDDNAYIDMRDPIKEMFPNIKTDIDIDSPYKEADLNIYVCQ